MGLLSSAWKIYKYRKIHHLIEAEMEEKARCQWSYDVHSQRLVEYIALTKAKLENETGNDKTELQKRIAIYTRQKAGWDECIRIRLNQIDQRISQLWER